MASAYLTKTSTTVTNDKKFTVSAWVKGSDLGGSVQAGVCGHRSTTNNGNNSFQFGVFNGGYYAAFVSNSGNDVHINKVTNRLLRDVNAWYHLVIAVDSTLGTASDRVKMYINGELQTSFSTDVNPPQDRTFLNNSCNIDVGRLTYVDGTFKYWDGAIAHFHFVDGTAYPASTFGETDTTTGIWKPKTAPSVTYGNNGFFLKMDNSGNMGLDSSGNSNNFTTSGTIIQNKDTPSNVFATLNPLGKITTTSTGSATFSNGNLTATDSGAQAQNFCTLGVSVNTNGKWYYEAKYTSTTQVRGYSVGWATDSCLYYGTYAQAGSFILKSPTGETYNGSWTSNGNTLSSGDILGVALDLENSEIKFYKNGVLDSTVSSISFVGDFIFPAIQWGVNPTSNGVLDLNFGNGYFGTTAVSSAQNPDDGNGIFEYDVPTGYRALCTKSINAEEYS